MALPKGYKFNSESIVKRKEAYFKTLAKKREDKLKGVGLNNNINKGNALAHQLSTPLEVLDLEKDIARRIKDKDVSISEGLRVLAEIRKIKELDKVEEKKGYERRIIVIEPGLFEVKDPIDVNKLSTITEDKSKQNEPIVANEKVECKQVENITAT